MSAKQLINIMAAKGYSIGRYKPGTYIYTYVKVNMPQADNEVITKHFTGNWRAFVKFCQELPDNRA